MASIEVSGSEITESLPVAAELEVLVAPFRERMQERTEEVIGEATGLLEKRGEWESALGNFATDAMLSAANELHSPDVQVAVTNNGGLRAPIRPGPITIGRMYELMPFENMLVVETLTGAQLRELAEEIVSIGGEPMAGLRIRVDDQGEVAEVTLDGRPLDPGGEYRVVTADYLANGGGALSVLWAPMAREDLGVTLRDAFIGYVRERGRIDPTLDGRIGWVRP